MTEKQKKIAIVAGVIIIALILLLLGKRSSAAVNETNIPGINVSIPGFTMPDRTPFHIDIPGLGQSVYDFNAISPCMCNGASTSAPRSSGSGVTLVFNEGNRGPNIYNNYTSSSSCKQTCLEYGPSQIINGRYYTPCAKWSDCGGASITFASYG